MKRNFEYSTCFEIEILMFSNQHPSMQLLEAPKHWKKCILVMDWPRILHWFYLKYFISIKLLWQMDYYLFYFFTKPINKPVVLCNNQAKEEVRLYSTIYIWRQQIVAKLQKLFEPQGLPIRDLFVQLYWHHNLSSHQSQNRAKRPSLSSWKGSSLAFFSNFWSQSYLVGVSIPAWLHFRFWISFYILLGPTSICFNDAYS